MVKTLKVSTSCFTTAGIKTINEDSAAIEVPTDGYLLSSKGVVACVADGVSSAEAGREASSTAVSRFIEEYFRTPDTWSVSRSGEKILSTLNLRLYRKSHEFVTSTKGYLCTFSTIVVKSRTAHFFHVGDSRVYKLSTVEGNPTLKQLTRDHAVMMGGQKPTLTRAIGMDNRLNIDYGSVEVKQGDQFLITSDGVHDFLTEAELTLFLTQTLAPNDVAERLCDRAAEAGSDDNISAAWLRIDQLPDENLEDYHAKLTRLPFPPELNVGEKIDGFQVDNVLFASARSQLYLVTDSDTGAQYAMKTPSHNYEDDASYIDRFIQEEWIGKRIQSPYVVKVIQQKKPRNFLYYLMEYIEGEGLDEWISRNTPPSPRQAIALVKDIAEGLKAFHENETVHQDLRPANIRITNDSRAIILDFGSVYVAGLAELHRPLVHTSALGTASYSDPLYIMGSNPGIQGDVYALATIAYEMFTGELPYGSAIEECRSAFDYNHLRYKSASLFNPVLPLWFDSALKKGTEFDLAQRYLTVDQLMQDLQQPNAEFLREEPMTARSASSIAFWQILSGFWFLTLLLVIYLFSQVSGG
ncbi:bifunctional protein-serine/threonine kinase/phosphatase [Simiduia litorea]|uniref:protein kinase domain-containing protein n=1 Tax=Simiduia litorea TaxID=1435348 RepID=UPI0036F416CF